MCLLLLLGSAAVEYNSCFSIMIKQHSSCDHALKAHVWAAHIEVASAERATMCGPQAFDALEEVQEDKAIELHVPPPPGGYLRGSY